MIHKIHWRVQSGEIIGYAYFDRAWNSNWVLKGSDSSKRLNIAYLERHWYSKCNIQVDGQDRIILGVDYE